MTGFRKNSKNPVPISFTGFLKLVGVGIGFAITKETEKYVPDFQSEIIDLSRLNDEALGDQVKLHACEFLEIIEREHFSGASYMQSIAEALAEEGRKQKREKTQKIKAELQEKIKQSKAALQVEKKKNFPYIKRCTKKLLYYAKKPGKMRKEEMLFLLNSSCKKR
jgi:hypothetical protein